MRDYLPLEDRDGPHKNSVVCPHCGYIHTEDLWDTNAYEALEHQATFTCHNEQCEKSFGLTADAVYWFTSHLVDDADRRAK